jgi:hypothetical protein
MHSNQQVFGALSIMALIQNCWIIYDLPGNDSLTNHPQINDGMPWVRIWIDRVGGKCILNIGASINV